MEAGAFFKSFWISPREHPDFAWAFFGRFSIYMGYQGIVTYLLYILQDYIGLGLDDANRMIAKLSTVTFVALVFAGLGSGLLSDAIGRRKPLVFFASFRDGYCAYCPSVRRFGYGDVLVRGTDGPRLRGIHVRRYGADDASSAEVARRKR